ncbi:S-layer homology domain-containing protein [Leptolyngbya sp. PL-A3]|uniref:S-layer homology domain-containing protein n=1 Tax=Leptolyngbya sp. PL-A3 TaxID=2933911 RepID=UPI0032972BD0
MSNISCWQAGTAAFLALGLTTATVAPLVSPAPAFAQTVNFSDVPDNHWAKGFITELTKMGIIEGFPDGTFDPDGPVTRAQFAAMLRRANANYWERPDVTESVDFDDVSTTYWAATSINVAIEAGFMRGYPGNIFRPEQAIPREQVFVSLANGLGYTQTLTQEPSSILNIYQDASSISGYALRGIAAATVNQLVVNYPNVARLRPQNNATRAQVAAAIYQGLVRDGKAPAINSSYIVTPTQ